MSRDSGWRYQTRADGGRITIWLYGEIDLTGAAELEQLLLDAVREADGVEVDLAELRFIDSTAIAALINGHNAGKAGHCRLTLTNRAAQVHRVLQMTGVLAELTA